MKTWCIVSPLEFVFSQDNHDRDRAQADRQLQHLNRERAELERSCSFRVLGGNVKNTNISIAVSGSLNRW